MCVIMCHCVINVSQFWYYVLNKLTLLSLNTVLIYYLFISFKD